MQLIVLQSVPLTSRTLHQWRAATKCWPVNWRGQSLDWNVDLCTKMLIYSSSMMHGKSRQLPECSNPLTVSLCVVFIASLLRQQVCL